MKLSKSVRIKNATIDLSKGTVTEIAKDNTNVYSLKKIFEEWDKVNGVNITIGKDDEVPSEE